MSRPCIQACMYIYGSISTLQIHSFSKVILSRCKHQNCMEGILQGSNGGSSDIKRGSFESARMQSLSVDFGPFGFTHLDRLDKCQSTCYRKWLAFTKVKTYTSQIINGGCLLHFKKVKTYTSKTINWGCLISYTFKKIYRKIFLERNNIISHLFWQ